MEERSNAAPLIFICQQTQHATQVIVFWNSCSDALSVLIQNAGTRTLMLHFASGFCFEEAGNSMRERDWNFGLESRVERCKGSRPAQENIHHPSSHFGLDTRQHISTAPLTFF